MNNEQTVCDFKIKELISALESIFKLHVTINDYTTGKFYRSIPIPNTFHCNLACYDVRRHPCNNELCRVFDTIEIPNILKNYKKGIIKRCQSNLYEFAYPLIKGNALLGVIFLGPFLIPKGSELACYSQPKSWEFYPVDQQFILSQVPTLTVLQVSGTKLLVDILLAHLAQLFLDPQMTLRKEKMARKDIILRYFSMNFSKKIQLKDLALHLMLSESRASDILRSEFKINFPQLLNTFRIDHAKQLLVNSNFSIEDISERCGFSDVTYFYQIFSRLTGISPGKYRRESGVQDSPENRIGIKSRSIPQTSIDR
jgi:AraC-like DNA-binding protein/ligand-binding sensor protein